MDETFGFLVVDELFDRYTIIVNAADRRTSVYCDECEQWVAEYEGDHISTHTEEDLLGQIVTDHRSDFDDRVEFDRNL